MTLLKWLGQIVGILIMLLVPLLGQALATCLLIVTKRPIWKAALWTMVVWAVPYLGPGIYLVVGTQWPYKRALLWPILLASLLLGALLLAVGH